MRERIRSDAFRSDELAAEAARFYKLAASAPADCLFPFQMELIEVP